MPGLTVETDSPSPLRTRPSQQQSPHSTGGSRSSSPVRPPYSPITPVLGPARLAASSGSNINSSTSQAGLTELRAYNYPNKEDTYASYTPAPKPLTESISFDSNPDVIAVRAAMSILQIQRQKAIADMQALQQMKERAVANSTEFAAALASGQIKTKADSLFPVSIPKDEHDGDASNSNDDNDNGTDTATVRPRKAHLGDSTLSVADSDHFGIGGDKGKSPSNGIRWPEFPKPQNVVRTPPINWAQYAVVGESLDKLHADQVARPNEGVPAKIGPQGEVVPVESPGKKHEGLGVTAPYVPGRDKIEKPNGTKKGSKR